MPSSLISLATLALVATPAVATSYDLLHTFDQSNFFQNFSFFSSPDPTSGFVQYLDYESAKSAGLAGVKSGNVYLGVDATNKYTTGGRPSTRVESNVAFNQGLLVADLAHIPGSACGIWPAFWTYGANWPAGGEIDIIEGINKGGKTSTVLHTGGTCTITTTKMTGSITNSECGENDGATGCVVEGVTGSLGDSFNTGGGGVYAMEWTSQAIKVWYFPRSQIPQSINSATPDSSSFGTPMAVFQGSCDFDSQFTAQNIIFNTDFCGSWAASNFASSGCPMSNPNDALASCEAYVGANPTAFSEAYWEIASVKVYKEGSGSPPPAASSSSKSSSSTSTTVSTSAKSSPTSSHTTSSTSHSVATESAAHTSESSAHTSPTTTSCPTKSTVTVTSTRAASSSAPVTKSASVLPTAKPGSSSSKLTTTTIIATSYVDICPSGYTTKTITHTVTYCPEDASTSSIGPKYKTTSKFCASGCGPSPTSVVVVVPDETSTSVPSDVETKTVSLPASSAKPTVVAPTTTSVIVSSSSTGGEGGSAGGVSSSVGASTSVGVSPAPNSSSSVRVLASSSVAPVAKPSGGAVPGVGSVGSSSSTAAPPAYTGAGSKMESSTVGLIAVVAAVVLFI